MKKTLGALMLTLITGSSLLFAQTGGTTDPFETQMRVYKAALKNYDFQTAINALYVMEAIKPERTDLNDSIAILYFEDERYAQATVVAQAIINSDPKRNDMLEMVAVSKQKLGMVKESLSDYEKLYAVDKQVFYLYQIATLQFQLERFGECLASIDQIVSSPDADKQKVNIPVQNRTQLVPMKAAAYNIRGICAAQLNQPEAAKENLNKALEIFPDFILAKANLDAINKKSDTKAAAPVKPGTTAPKSATPATGKH